MLYSHPGGVPHILHVDNGKDYTEKTMTGQSRKKRNIDFEFDAETVGFYQSIGIEEVGRSLPYQPWDKPIERFFSTVCSKFSKWFESYTGTLTGSKTYAKRQKDVDGMLERGELLTMEEFFEVVDEVEERASTTPGSTGASSDAGEKWITPISLFENGERYEKAAPPREYAAMLLMKADTARVTNQGINKFGTLYTDYELCHYVGKHVGIKWDIDDVTKLYVFDHGGPEDMRSRLRRAAGLRASLFASGARAATSATRSGTSKEMREYPGRAMTRPYELRRRGGRTALRGGRHDRLDHQGRDRALEAHLPARTTRSSGRRWPANRKTGKKASRATSFLGDRRQTTPSLCLRAMNVIRRNNMEITAAAAQATTYTTGKTLRTEQINDYLAVSQHSSIATLASDIPGYSRTDRSPATSPASTRGTSPPSRSSSRTGWPSAPARPWRSRSRRRKTGRKPVFYESRDALKVLGVCQSCQEYIGLGIVVARSGYGKTYSLRQYAKLPRVAYIECDDTMSSPRPCGGDRRSPSASPAATARSGAGSTASGTSSTRTRDTSSSSTRRTSWSAKYTQKKMEILRAIFDQSDVGLVIAGEPKLEAQIKTYLARMANRVDFYVSLKGLDPSEVEGYLEGFEVDPDAMVELKARACNMQTGCFRLLDRTLSNVTRILEERGERVVTVKIIEQASSLMML